MAKKTASVKTQRMVTDIVVHIFLTIVAIISIMITVPKGKKESA